MPDPVVSQSPAVIATAPVKISSNSSPEDTAVGNADGNAAVPFAAVLQKQVDKSNGKDSKDANSDANDPRVTLTEAATANQKTDLLALLMPQAAGDATPQPTVNTDATTDDPSSIPQTDVSALLGQLLASMSSSHAGVAPEENKEMPVAEDAQTTEAPTLIATIVPPAGALPLPTQVTKASSSSETALSPSPLRSAPTLQAKAADETSRPVAIIAADTPVLAKSAAGSGNSGTKDDTTSPPPIPFDSLLKASHEASVTAMNHAVAAHAPGGPSTSNQINATIAAPIGTPGWDGELGEKVTWMANRQETHAELVLNPPHLGRIEVSLSMNGDQANAIFVSANPVVRDALENALPRLREILQDAGISLGQAQVGAESFQQQAGNRGNGDNPASNKSNDRTLDALASSGVGAIGGASMPWLRRGNGLVDTFA